MAGVENSNSSTQTQLWSEVHYDLETKFFSPFPVVGLALFPLNCIFDNDVKNRPEGLYKYDEEGCETQRYRALTISAASTTAILALIVFLRLMFVDDLGEATAEKAMCGVAAGTAAISFAAAIRFSRIGKTSEQSLPLKWRHVMVGFGAGLAVAFTLIALLYLPTNKRNRIFGAKFFTGAALAGVTAHSVGGLMCLWKARKRKAEAAQTNELQQPATVKQEGISIN